MSDSLVGSHFGVEYEKFDHTAVITLDRPEAGNALSRRMRPTISAIWEDVKADADVRCVVVTGRGERHFCTGVDVKEVAAEGGPTTGMGRVEEEIVWSPLHRGVWKPVICALNGLVAGGGLHFVADADIVIAAPHVQLMDTHTSIGMVGAVENVGLAHRMPLGSALRMTLVGKGYRMPVQRAYELGLVDEIYEASELRDRALEMAAAIAQNSPTAVMRSKQAIWEGVGRGVHDGAEYAWALARMHRAHPDALEGARAFAERREPRWVQ